MQTTWLFWELNHSWIRINMQVNKSCVLGEDWVIKIKISETGNLLTELISSIYVQQNKLFWMCRQCDLLLGPESKFTLPCIKHEKNLLWWRLLKGAVIFRLTAHDKIDNQHRITLPYFFYI